MTPDDWLACRENTAEWARLLRHLRLGDHFRLLAARVVSARAERLLEHHLERAAAAEGVDLRRLDLSTLGAGASLPGALWARLKGAERPVWCVVRGGDAPGAVIAEQGLFLNQKRDVLRARLPGALVLALHPIEWAELRLRAPDLWSVHTDVLRFWDAAPPGRPGFVDAPLRAEGRRAGLDFGLARSGLGAADLGPLVDAVSRAPHLIEPSIRSLLLSRMPGGVVDRLPFHSNPRDQILSDLAHLSAAGLPSLLAWVDNAAAITSNPEVATHLRMIADELLDRARAAEGLPSHADAIRDAIAAVERLVARTDARASALDIDEAIADATRLLEAVDDADLYAAALARVGWAHGMLGDRRSADAACLEGVSNLPAREYDLPPATAEARAALDALRAWIEQPD